MKEAFIVWSYLRLSNKITPAGIEFSCLVFVQFSTQRTSALLGLDMIMDNLSMKDISREIASRIVTDVEPGMLCLRLLDGCFEKNNPVARTFDGPVIGHIKEFNQIGSGVVELVFDDGFRTGLLTSESDGFCISDDYIYFQNSYYPCWNLAIS